MKRWIFLFAAALLFAALPDPAAAQSRTADGWWDWAGRSDRDARTERASPRTQRDTKRRGTIRPRTTRDDRRSSRADRRRDRDDGDDRWDRDDDDRWDRDDDRWEDRRGDNRVRHNAPPFCRNGQGHPTKGMAWCYDKGYADERYDRRTDDRWERRSIEDIIFGTPRDRDRRARTVSGSVLDDILGRGALRELAGVSSGALTGRWVYPDSASRVLQLRDGRGPLAEMTDFDGDGRVDLVLVNRDR